MAGNVKRLYLNPLFSGSFSGVSAFMKNRKLKNKELVINELNKLKPYVLHKPARSKFPRRKFMVHFKNEQIQIDLIDLSRYSKDNNGYKYLLTAIDVFSKKAHIVPIKTKQTKSAVEGIKKVIKILGRPRTVLCDRGNEFVGKMMKKYLESIGIKLMHVYSEHKASVVERFHRTLMSRLSRYWTHTGNRKYIKALPLLLKGYNNTKHRTTKFAPNDVNDSNEHLVWRNTFEKYFAQRNREPKFNVGDIVLISRIKALFTKGYEQNFVDTPYKVTKVRDTQPPTYELTETVHRKNDEGKNLPLEKIEGGFYEQELAHFIPS